MRLATISHLFSILGYRYKIDLTKSLSNFLKAFFRGSKSTFLFAGELIMLQKFLDVGHFYGQIL